MSVKIHPMVCGWLEVDAGAILAGESGNLKLPIPSYLLEHPRGRLVFDTGLHRDLQRDSSRLGKLAKAFTVRFKAGEDLAAQLQARQFDPARIDYMVNSHLHFDHVGGNADLPNAKLIVQRREWEATKDPKLVKVNGYNHADFDLGHQLQLIDGEHDVFGDGSIVCFPSYGHTAGHQSLRVRTDTGEYVMTADSCYMRKVFEEMVLPPFAFSYDAMREVIERYRKMERAGARLIFGHDAAQWNSDGTPAAPIG
jgi:glyoxylase-like metal-dependent hydrolase (beta-lactamase superfamily II)